MAGIKERLTPPPVSKSPKQIANEAATKKAQEPSLAQRAVGAVKAGAAAVKKTLIPDEGRAAKNLVNVGKQTYNALRGTSAPLPKRGNGNGK